MEKEKDKIEQDPDKFNLGLATQMHIHELFGTASYCAVRNNAYIRANAILSVKRIASSEYTEEERKFFDAKEKEIIHLQRKFENFMRTGTVTYDLSQSRFKFMKCKEAFSVYESLEDCLNELEQALRIKLRPMLFPKKRGAGDAAGA